LFFNFYCGQQVTVVVVQHAAGALSFLLTNFAAIIAAAARIMTIKATLFQGLFFFLGVQHPSLQPQFCFKFR
jgi:hypothetical protein